MTVKRLAWVVWAMLLPMSISSGLCAVDRRQADLTRLWRNGENFVPVIEQRTVHLVDGTTITLHPGMPALAYRSAPGGVPQFILSLYDTSTTLPRQAMPSELDAYWLYREGNYSAAAMALEREAKDDSNPLVRCWKYILAGHSCLMVTEKNLPRALDLYRKAATTPSNPFRPFGRYFLVRALLAQNNEAEAQRELQALMHSPEAGFLTRNRLLWVQRVGGLPSRWFPPSMEGARSLLCALDEFVESRERTRQLDKIPDEEQKADALLDYALAAEKLWQVKWEDSECYIFFGIVPYLEPVFKSYPRTWAAEQAYYRYLMVKGTGDYEGDNEAAYADWCKLRRKFIEKYPRSILIYQIDDHIDEFGKNMLGDRQRAQKKKP